MRVHGATVLLLLVSACGGARSPTDAAFDTASHDFGCSQVVVQLLPSGPAVAASCEDSAASCDAEVYAEGCGHSGVYRCAEGNFNGWSCALEVQDR